MKKNASMPRVLILISGILITILGVLLFANPIANSAYIGYFISFMLLFSGISEIAYFIKTRNVPHVSGWALANGIITTLMAILLLFKPNVQVLTMAILLAVWVLFSGVMRISYSATLKNLDSRRWGWVLAAGIIGVIVGFILIVRPVIGVLAIGFSLPIIFITQGILMISSFFTLGED